MNMATFKVTSFLRLDHLMLAFCMDLDSLLYYHLPSLSFLHPENGKFLGDRDQIFYFSMVP